MLTMTVRELLAEPTTHKFVARMIGDVSLSRQVAKARQGGTTTLSLDETIKVNEKALKEDAMSLLTEKSKPVLRRKYKQLCDELATLISELESAEAEESMSVCNSRETFLELELLRRYIRRYRRKVTNLKEEILDVSAQARELGFKIAPHAVMKNKTVQRLRRRVDPQSNNRVSSRDLKEIVENVKKA